MAEVGPILCAAAGRRNDRVRATPGYARGCAGEVGWRLSRGAAGSENAAVGQAAKAALRRLSALNCGDAGIPAGPGLWTIGDAVGRMLDSHRLRYEDGLWNEVVVD